MVRDYQRILREDWTRRGINAFVQEWVRTMETAAPTSDESVDEEEETTTTSTAGNAFSGEVISGTGDTYVVELHTGDRVTATVPGILSTEEIPAGATAVVIQEDEDTYTLHFPLWLE